VVADGSSGGTQRWSCAARVFWVWASSFFISEGWSLIWREGEKEKTGKGNG